MDLIKFQRVFKSGIKTDGDAKVCVKTEQVCKTGLKTEIVC